MSKPQISLVQTFALIVGIIIGGGVLNLPAGLAQAINQEGWIGAMIGGIFSILILNLAFSLLRKYPDQNILQISRHLLGKYLGNLLNLAYMFYFLLASGTILRISASVISSWILPKTPIEILLISFLFAAFLLTRYGLQVAARFSEIIFFFMLPFTILIFYPIGHWKLYNLLPIGTYSISEYLSASLVSVYAYTGFEIVLFLYPHIKGNFKKIRFTSNLAVMFSIFIYVALSIGVIASFGAERLQNELFVALKYSQLTRFVVVERVEFLIIFFWIFALFHSFGLFFYFGYTITEDLFSIKKRHWSGLLTIPLYYVALYPSNIADLAKMARFFGVFGLITIVSSLILLNGISFFKK